MTVFWTDIVLLDSRRSTPGIAFVYVTCAESRSIQIKVLDRCDEEKQRFLFLVSDAVGGVTWTPRRRE